MKRINSILMIVPMLMLSGCNPLSARVEKTKLFVQTTDASANLIAKAYQSEIKTIQAYEVYRYQGQLDDPFRTRDFIVANISEDKQLAVKDKKDTCEPPKCVPPLPHDKSVLETFDLNELVFVGTLEQEDNVALVKAPNLGVLQVRRGDYLGKYNGKVLDIKKNVIILHEKVNKDGIWKNKKRVLTLKR